MNSMIRSNQKAGGTLIEVLVSLVIITLVLSSVLDVTAHRRRTLVDSRRNQAALDLAIAWQSARLNGDKWSMGEDGGFPGRDDMRWFLEKVEVPTVEGGSALPDEPWRRLVVVHMDRGIEENTPFMFRLDRLAEAGAP